MSRQFEIYIDGACSGNPGPAGIGVVIKEHGNVIKEISLEIGEATNNIAEYSALIFALQEALISNVETVKIFTDSELVCNQFNGNYKVKHPNIKFLYEQAKHLAQGFKDVQVNCIPREQNKEADKLATKLIAKRQVKMVASLFEAAEEESPSSEG